MKRIFLFATTNIAVLVVMSVVMKAFGIDDMLARNGQDPIALLIMAAIMGFGGSFISLATSKWMAKRSMGVYVITEPRNTKEIWLLNTVKRQADAAGITMPEVGIFESPDMNAFATGARRNAALVAVSTGLLNVMSEREAEAVLGHEISHVANGDMVTLTLIQGVVNTFVIFLSRIIGGIIDNMVSGNRDRRSGPGPFYFAIVMVLQIVLGILASMIVAWFSRYREFRADAGGAKLSTRQNMISALERLQQRHSAPLPEQMRAFGITGGKLSKLFASHPPLEVRIATLRSAA
ncbi:MAG TPA: protease HtpX [Steroidobacteraceae bacterium]|nr:protease HtpX [Steroidobacteraceae bacterium]